MKKFNTLCKSTTTLDVQTVILVLSYLNIWKVCLLVYIVVFIFFSLVLYWPAELSLIVKT